MLKNEKINVNKIENTVIENMRQKRFNDLINAQNSPELWRFMGDLKKENQWNKSKTMRRIAAMPPEVDMLFTRFFGKDYFKDRDFFKKFPEWLVVDKL